MSYNAVTESVSCSKSTSKIMKIQRPPELSEDYTDMDCSATTEYVSTHLQATSQKQDASYLPPHQISTELSTSTESEEFHEKANPTYEESDYIYECWKESDAEVYTLRTWHTDIYRKLRLLHGGACAYNSHSKALCAK